jgi:hypothetical protein
MASVRYLQHVSDVVRVDFGLVRSPALRSAQLLTPPFRSSIHDRWSRIFLLFSYDSFGAFAYPPFVYFCQCIRPTRYSSLVTLQTRWVTKSSHNPRPRTPDPRLTTRFHNPHLPKAPRTLYSTISNGKNILLLWWSIISRAQHRNRRQDTVGISGRWILKWVSGTITRQVAPKHRLITSTRKKTSGKGVGGEGRGNLQRPMLV